MENKFRKEEKCVCCSDELCDSCDCEELEKEIQKEKKQ